MVKKILAFYFSEIRPFPKQSHFRKGKKVVTILGNVTILGVTIMSGDRSKKTKNSAYDNPSNGENLIYLLNPVTFCGTFLLIYLFSQISRK